MNPVPAPLAGRVLVVDDHQLSRRLYGRWLVSAGFETQLAGSANEATALMGLASFDLALVDVSMPGHDGLWLAEYIRRHQPRTQVIFVTGIEELPATETLGPGVAGYLLKPIEREDLLGVVRQAARGSALWPSGTAAGSGAPHRA